MDNLFLTGKCLVAMPNIDDERFEKAVVYMCSHNAEGAMGIVINKQIEDFYFEDLVSQFEISSPIEESLVLHQGGPLEKVRGFVLHSGEYSQDGTVVINKHISVSSSIGVLNDIAIGVGPQYNLIALGYSSWKPKQLEKEIVNNTWQIIDPDYELLFVKDDEEKWEYAVSKLGFDINSIYGRTARA